MIARGQKKPELFPMNSAECVRVVQIAEMDGIGHARRCTGRAQALFHSMNAEMTLPHITSGRFIPLEMYVSCSGRTRERAVTRTA